MVTSAVLLPLASLGARLQADTLGEPKVSIERKSDCRSMHACSCGCPNTVFSWNSTVQPAYDSKFTPESTLQRALPPGRRAAGVWKLALSVGWLYLPKPCPAVLAHRLGSGKSPCFRYAVDRGSSTKGKWKLCKLLPLSPHSLDKRYLVQLTIIVSLSSSLILTSFTTTTDRGKSDCSGTVQRRHQARHACHRRLCQNKWVYKDHFAI